ncbi:MAG: glycosyltransferase family 9 protein [Geobacteraceae bacterium]|nr:glycosyltransferase family 9 protein [Geobacteraceae bacterium]
MKSFDALIGTALANLLPVPVKRTKVSITTALFIRPGGIGDALLLAPAINVFRKHFPDVCISVLAEKRNAGVFTLIPAVERVYSYDFIKDVIDFHNTQYDIIIDTEQWHRLSAVCSRIIPSIMKIGFNTNNRERMFTDSILYRQTDYEAQSFLNLLKPLGINEKFDYDTRFLHVPEPVKEQIYNKMGLKLPYVTIFPGASIKERRWGLSKFNSLAKHLSNIGILPVIVGGKEDIYSGDIIVNGTLGINLAGKTSLTGTAAIISRSKLLISSDSGVLHIAVGLGIPTVSLFGSGIAAKWAPRGDLHKVVHSNQSCAPCTVFGTTPRCDNGVKCLEDINVQDVLIPVQVLLNM